MGLEGAGTSEKGLYVSFAPGHIVPTVIETIHNVDQFLGLSPEEYVKKPRLVNLKGTFAE